MMGPKGKPTPSPACSSAVGASPTRKTKKEKKHEKKRDASTEKKRGSPIPGANVPRKVVLYSSYLLLAVGEILTLEEELDDGWCWTTYQGKKCRFPRHKIMELRDVQREAGAGDVAAQHELAVRYHTGKGLPEDAILGSQWLKRAAEGGFSRAQYAYARSLADGTGVTKDEEAAIRWHMKAAEQGNLDSVYMIGLSYEHGYGIKQDYSQAFTWYKKGSALCDCQRALGLCYVNGWGVKANATKAVKWYKRSAEQANVSAMYDYACMLESGEGVPVDKKEAQNWFRCAAEKGDSKAQLVMGDLCRMHAADTYEELYWYCLAAEQNEEQAEDWVERLLKVNGMEKLQ